MQTRKRFGTPVRRGGKKVDNKEAVEVVCRLCPYTGKDACAILIDETHLKLVSPPSFKNTQTATESIYKLSYIFDETDNQETVFDRVTIDLIGNLLQGKNSLLFTYGVTGSGKTYTMTGDTTESASGILPRTLDVIFNSLPNRVDKCVFYPNGRNSFGIRGEFEATLARRRLEICGERSALELANRYFEQKRVSGVSDDMLCAIFVSYIEIYNDICYDLLDEPIVNRDGTRSLASKEVRSDGNNITYVDGLTEVEVESSNEALEQFFRGQELRRFADTTLNKQSSRSHSIFTIRLVMAPCQFDVYHPVNDESKIHVSFLSLVDLAGSERTKRTKNEGVRLFETSKINQSLFVLRQCFDKLRENQQQNFMAPNPVPYRDSKLTYLFKNYFEGNGKVRMILCVNPQPMDYSENLFVLSFAETAQTIEVAKSVDMPSISTDGFPMSRRQFIKWSNEIENIVLKSSNILRARKLPNLEIDDLDSDDEIIPRIRSFYQAMAEDNIALSEKMEQTEEKFGVHLKRILCLMDTEIAKIKIFEAEKVESTRTITKLTSLLKQSRRENQALRYRIERYEKEESNKLDQVDEQKRREKHFEEQLRKKEKTLNRVLEICEKPARKVRKYPSTADLASSEIQNLKPETSNNPYQSQPAVSTVVSGVKRADVNRGRANNVTAKIGYYNSRFHRRSKSANGRIVDHQARIKVPTGTIMQPKSVKNAKQTINPEASDLRKSSEYVLMHQQIDEEGNLSTHLVKGDCIPTAGGGTAVCFTGVESLTQNAP